MSLLKMAMAAKMGGGKLPFGEGENYKIEMDMSGTVISDSMYTAFLVSDTPLIRSEVIGATAVGKCLNDSSCEVSTIINETHIEEETPDGMFIKVDDSIYYRQYIFVAYTTNYKPSALTKTLPAKGVYFVRYNDYDNPYVASLEGVRVIPIDNDYLDLVNHPLIKYILAKLG